MLVCLFGGGVSRAGAFVRGEAFENSNPHPAIGFAWREVGYGGANAELWRGVASLLGRADVQLFVVGRLGVVLGRVAVCPTSFVRIVIAWTVEFVANQGI